MSTVSISSISRSAVDEGAHTQVVRFTANWNACDLNPPFAEVWTKIQLVLSGGTYTTDYPSNTECGGFEHNIQGSNPCAGNDFLFTDGSAGRPAVLAADTSYQVRGRMARVAGTVGCGSINFTSSSTVFKADAVAATGSNLTESNVTATTADISGTFTPSTVESTATARIEYKRAIDGSNDWVTAGVTETGQGYSPIAISRSLTGLLAETTYNARIVITRDVNDGSGFVGGGIGGPGTLTFTTDPPEPSVLTLAATGVDFSTATLNAAISMDEQPGTLTFLYGTATPPVANETAGIAVTVNGSYSKGVTGLSATTLYYFRAKYVWNDGVSNQTTLGDILSFTTPADPGAQARETEAMQVFDYDRKYGTSTTLTFVVPAIAATSSDRFVNAAVPWIAGDVKISKDGGAVANVTNLPTRIGTTPLYTITLEAAELEAEVADIYLVDADGPTWRDTLLRVRTKQRLGQVFVDATALGSNNAAVTYTGVGTSPGLSVVGGATSSGDIGGVIADHVMRRSTATAGGASSITLDASASATNDYYNGGLIHLISGTGLGQARVITDYNGTTKVATVNRSWATNPASGSVFEIVPGPDVWNIAVDGELAAVPSATGGNHGLMLQFVFQRFALKRTQTTTTQTLFKNDSSTSLATGAVDDNGTTQTSGKMS